MDINIKKIWIAVTKHPFKLVAVIFFISFFSFYIYGYDNSSKEAFINARVARILSPTQGTLNFSHGIFPGQHVAKNQMIGSVLAAPANDQIIQLTAQYNELDIQIAVVKEQITGLEKRLAIYKTQQEKYISESEVQRKLELNQAKSILLQLRNELKAIDEKTRDFVLIIFSIFYLIGTSIVSIFSLIN
ncbi:hypothetical protein [Providencia stuartii]|uniref:hypothetical protein n=1 Tax=Providencia stuartii TaxID=588 RepID=UPI002886190A|nr:hypothetical protein [Providencia stuartii]MDT1067484.1 hypothetical protein [Providencia stuartii]